MAAKDIELHPWYGEELELQRNGICELPKRFGGTPQEYYEIIAHAEEHFSHILSREEKITRSIIDLNIFCTYKMFHRWELVAEKMPKPRKPILVDFDVEKFKEKYSLWQ